MASRNPRDGYWPSSSRHAAQKACTSWSRLRNTWSKSCRRSWRRRRERSRGRSSVADTIRQLAALQALFPDNTAGEISPQDLRDFLVSALPTGRSATKVVASAAASDLRQAQADYVLGGPDIQAAIAAAGAGKVELTEGEFSIAAAIVLANKTTLQG